MVGVGTQQMNLRQLEAFQAVMQSGSMSSAAKLLCVTPSAVSKIITHTELQLGFKLFTRHQGALVPTPEARVLFEESAPVHRQLDHLRQIATNLGRPDAGRVRLAAIPAITHELLPFVLQRHAALHPRVEVEVRTVNQDQMSGLLLSRTVDFCLGHYSHVNPQVVSDLLISAPTYLVTTRDIWQRFSRNPHQTRDGFFSKVPLISLVGEDPIRPVVDGLAQRMGLQSGQCMFQVQTSRLAVQLVRRGMGWTVVDFLTAHQLDAQNMVAVELPDCPYIPLYAYHAQSHPPGQLAKRMLDMLPGLLHEIRATATSANIVVPV